MISGEKPCPAGYNADPITADHSSAGFFARCFYALFFEPEGLLSQVLLASLVKFRI